MHKHQPRSAAFDQRQAVAVSPKTKRAHLPLFTRLVKRFITSKFGRALQTLIGFARQACARPDLPRQCRRQTRSAEAIMKMTRGSKKTNEARRRRRRRRRRRNLDASGGKANAGWGAKKSPSTPPRICQLLPAM